MLLKNNMELPCISIWHRHKFANWWHTINVTGWSLWVTLKRFAVPINTLQKWRLLCQKNKQISHQIMRTALTAHRIAEATIPLTNLPTRLPIILLIRQTIVCTRVGICSTQHQLCSDRILADHVFIIGSEKFSITKSSSQVSCKQHEAYLLFLFCLSVCSEFTDWIA